MKRNWLLIALGLVALCGCQDAAGPQPTAKPAATNGTETTGAATNVAASTDSADDASATADIGDAATGDSTAESTPPAVETADDLAAADAPESPNVPEPASELTGSSPAAATASTAAAAIPLTPENTKVQFVGAHVAADQPDRTGTFERLSGTATLADDGSLASVAVDIEADSLTTDFEKLTTHLNSEDFLDTRQHPTIRFESTKVEAGADGQATITGDLTLMGVTKEVSFPATVEVAAGKLMLSAEFTIDRTEFGMDKFTDQVKPTVALTVAVDAAGE